MEHIHTHSIISWFLAFFSRISWQSWHIDIILTRGHHGLEKRKYISIFTEMWIYPPPQGKNHYNLFIQIWKKINPNFEKRFPEYAVFNAMLAKPPIRNLPIHNKATNLCDPIGPALKVVGFTLLFLHSSDFSYPF